MLIPNKFNGYSAGRRLYPGGGGGGGGGDGGVSGFAGDPEGPSPSVAADAQAAAPSFGSLSGPDGGFGGSGNDSGGSYGGSYGIDDLLKSKNQSMLSDNYTPQDSTQRQFYQPVYEPSYTDYNQGNPLAVSQYGQNYSSPFGQFVNPFSYSPQFSPQQLYAPQMSYAPDSGFDDYGIAGLYR